MKFPGEKIIHIQASVLGGCICFQWVVGLGCQFLTGKQSEDTSGFLTSKLPTAWLLESSSQQEETNVLKPTFHS